MKRIITTLALSGGMALTMLAGGAPVFPGGEAALNEYISQNLKYPASAKGNGIEGTVNLTFTVKADGSIGAIKVDRMIDPDLEQEAIRLVKSMPKWEPATDASGSAMDSQAKVAIPFTL